MREKLRFTLVADGPSDRALLPILQWLLRKHVGSLPLEPQFADLRGLRQLPAQPRSFPARIAKSVDLYPGDLLFIHRDAENQPPEKRRQEIRDALEQVPAARSLPWAGVVPVRMQEAWLLIDEAALRKAAGNPHGKQPVKLPAARTLERVQDPKKVLRELLCKASGRRGRKLSKFKRGLSRRSGQVAELIGDFSPLRALPAFRRLEKDLRKVLQEMDGVSAAGS